MLQPFTKALTLAALSLVTLSACQSSQPFNRMAPLQQPVLQRGTPGLSALGTGFKRRPKLGLKLLPNRRRVRMAPEDLLPLGQRAQGLPNQVDLRRWASPIDDQADLGACTGFSIKAARELMLIRDGQEPTTLSPLFIYYYERQREGTVDEDAGATIVSGMEVLKEIGVAREALWSYDPSNDNNPDTKEKFQLPPSAEANQDAGRYRVKGIRPLETLRAIRYALAHRSPVIIGIEVYEAFYETNGWLPRPNPKEASQGGHAVTVVGYDDVKEVLIVKNSWGPAWGDKGYFYLPYDYVKLGLASDAWTAE
ncbi:MAG: C1 family peptidase [Candidatus Sericytochromatia bacterium]